MRTRIKLKVIEKLFQLGAEPNTCDLSGKTASMAACELGFYKDSSYKVVFRDTEVTLNITLKEMYLSWPFIIYTLRFNHSVKHRDLVCLLTAWRTL